MCIRDSTETFDGNKTAIKEAASVLESQGVKYRNLSIAVSYTHLYEMQQQLGAGFMQISKSTLVNLSYMSNVEAGFSLSLIHI